MIDKVQGVILILIGLSIGAIVFQVRIVHPENILKRYQKDFKFRLDVKNYTSSLSFDGIHNILSNDNDVKRPVSPGGVDDVTTGKLRYISHMYRDDRVDCAAVLRHDNHSIEHAIAVAKSDHLTMFDNATVDEFFSNEAKSCSKFLMKYGFITNFLSEEEKDFPIAYSMIVYTQTEMVLRLLRSIYRPQNVYCIHVDKKLGDSRFFQVVAEIAACFPNVFMSSRRVKVGWGQYSVLDAEFACMEDLWKFKHWKYFINLTGQEFPLKTNYEIVKILKSFKGANDVGGTIKQ